MNKLFVTLTAFGLMALSAVAQPFLVCDPVPKSSGSLNTQPTGYTITGIGTTAINTTATVNADGSVQLHYDLGTTPAGTYTVTVVATNSAGSSAPSAPFTFILPFITIPSVPSNIHLSTQ